MRCLLPSRLRGRGGGRVVPSNGAATRHQGSNAATKHTSRRPTPPPEKTDGHLHSLEGARHLRSPLRERRMPSRSSWDGVAPAPLASLHGSCPGTTSPRRCWEPPSPYPSHSASLRGRGLLLSSSGRFPAAAGIPPPSIPRGPAAVSPLSLDPDESRRLGALVQLVAAAPESGPGPHASDQPTAVASPPKYALCLLPPASCLIGDWGLGTGDRGLTTASPSRPGPPPVP
jgi:hypothetical protein